MITTTLAITLLTIPLAAATAPTIANGDFATAGAGFGGAANWTLAGAYGRTTLAGGGPAGPSDYYMLVDGGGCPSGNAPSVSQTLTGLTPGTSYLVQFQLKRYANYGAGTPGTLGVFVDGTLSYTNSVVSSQWNSDLFQFTATSTTAVLKFSTERRYATDQACEDTSYGIDNVSLSAAAPSLPAPELPAIALVGVGGVAVAGFVALRRKQ